MPITIYFKPGSWQQDKWFQVPEYNCRMSGPSIPAKSLKTQFKIMKKGVARCPSLNLNIMGKQTPSMLDFSSMGTLIWQDYFNHYFRPQLGPAEGSESEAHNVCDLKCVLYNIL